MRASRTLVRVIACGLALSPLVVVGALDTAAVGVAPQAAILPTVGFGLTVSPPGPYNGPLASSALAQYIEANPAAANLIKSGELSGYVRRWDGDYPVRATVLITLFLLPSPSAVTAFASGYATSFAQDSTIPMTSVRNAAATAIPGSYTMKGSTTKNGVPLEQSEIIFSRGLYVVSVLSVTADSELSYADVAAIARNQRARLSATVPTGTVSTNADYRAGEIFGAFLTGVFVVGLVFVVRSHKRSERAKARPPAPPLWPTDKTPITTAPPRVPYSPAPPTLAASGVAPPPVDPPTPRAAPSFPPATNRLAPESERPSAPPDNDPRTSFWDE